MKCEILQSLKESLAKSDEWNADTVNKECSKYLFESPLKLKNEDVFFLLRFAVSGNPVGAPTGDICEVIGKEKTLKRCEEAINYLK